MVYDQTARKIYVFLASKVLVIFKDLVGTESSPFTIYKTQHDVAFNTDAARYIESADSGITDKTVYFGDDNGNIFDMNGTKGNGDAGSYDVQVIRKLPLQEFDYSNKPIEGRVYYRRNGECELNIDMDWGDERNTTDISMILKGSVGVAGNYYGGEVYYGGVFYYNEGAGGDGNPVSRGFSAIGRGTSVFVTLSLETSEYFEVDYIDV